MVNIEKRKVRTNGFQWPLHPTQLLTYFIFFGDLFTFYGINMVSLSYNTWLTILLSTVYGVLCVLVFYYAYLATITDPTDPTIQLEK